MDDNKKPDDTTDKTAENVSKPPDSKKESDSSSDSESTKSDHSSGKEQPTQKVKKKRKKKKKKNKDKQNSDSEGEDNNDKHGNEGQPKAKPAVKAVLPLPRKHDALYTLTVALRIRPLSPEEKADGSFSIAYKLDERVKFKFSLYQTCSIHMVVVLRDADDVENKLPKIREKHFVFDRTLGPDATQKEVYDKSAKSLIAGLFDGFNATVFAYGATGAGKTYTMIGTSGKPGIMARSLDDVYKSVQNVDHGNEYEIVMSYLEIYNEQIKDLLIDDSGNLELREDVRGAIQVTGLTELRATSSRDMLEQLVESNRRRTTEPTKHNEVSSRSHAILMVNIVLKPEEAKKPENKGRKPMGRLVLIDLAGSEKASEEPDEQRKKEGAHINRSLLALGNVINTLSKIMHLN